MRQLKARGFETRLIKSLYGLFFALLILPLSALAEDAVILICSPDVEVTSVSPHEVTDIFLGRKRMWNDGRRILPAVLDSGAIQKRFFFDCVGKSERQFWRHWRNLVFSGQGIMPKVFTSKKELLAYVAAQKGAVGYVLSFNGDQHAGVKTIRILKGADQ